jgi:uncharacterized membrane protein YdjX (TVP38/TMEM64 family)
MRGGGQARRMVSSDASLQKKKLPVVKLAVGAVVVAALGVVTVGVVGIDTIKAQFTHGLALLQAAGPVTYFTAMALLPAAGFPMMAFTLTAGPTFGAQLGLGGVLVASSISIGASLIITYWLARRWLRPPLEKLVTRAGYKIPVVEPADQAEVTLLLRITPGPPFFFQNYLLGLAGISFRTYFFVSWPLLMLQTAGFVIFGESLAAGKGRQALLGISVIVAVMLGVHILRRHYSKRKKT